MSSRTKIVVLRMKEIIYTAIFIGLGILLITLLFIMFGPGKDTSETASAPAAAYVPGVYSASIVLGSQNVDVEVAVDENYIQSITYVPLSDSVETMYPLMQPALDQLAEQICATQSLENLTYAEQSQYTSRALLQAIEVAIGKAKVDAERK